MNKRFPVWLFLLWGITCLSFAQVPPETRHPYSFDYTTIILDSTYDAQIDPKLSRYVDKKRQKMDKIMNVVIGHCDETLTAYTPASPLSNFLTDILLQYAPISASEAEFEKCDVSLLNFGGIRASLNAGDITVGDIYAVSPFDNYVVFATLKGSELKKIFMKFTDKHCEPYAGAQITYRNGKPIAITVNGQPVEDERLYHLATLNFILEGGDDILTGIIYEKTFYTPVIFRDFLISEIKKMTQNGQTIQRKLDQRVIIKVDL